MERYWRLVGVRRAWRPIPAKGAWRGPGLANLDPVRKATSTTWYLDVIDLLGHSCFRTWILESGPCPISNPIPYRGSGVYSKVDRSRTCVSSPTAFELPGVPGEIAVWTPWLSVCVVAADSRPQTKTVVQSWEREPTGRRQRSNLSPWVLEHVLTARHALSPWQTCGFRSRGTLWTARCQTVGPSTEGKRVTDSRTENQRVVYEPYEGYAGTRPASVAVHYEWLRSLYIRMTVE